VLLLLAAQTPSDTAAVAVLLLLAAETPSNTAAVAADYVQHLLSDS
jgi:hypothetical protein